MVPFAFIVLSKELVVDIELLTPEVHDGRNDVSCCSWYCIFVRVSWL